jgi:hypothetical protein
VGSDALYLECLRKARSSLHDAFDVMKQGAVQMGQDIREQLQEIKAIISSTLNDV